MTGRTQEANKKEKRRHRTPAELMCVLLTLLMHWFPERKFLFAGNGAYGTHQVSRFAYRHRQRLGLVSKFVADANVSLSVKAIIEMYAARWNIETTFQEMRSHLGLETTCGWSKQTVLRMAPLLFCLYTLVVIFFDTMPWSSPHVRVKSWIGKECTTFSDMMLSVRRYLWVEWIFAQVPGGRAVFKLPSLTRRLIDYGLTQAA